MKKGLIQFPRKVKIDGNLTIENARLQALLDANDEIFGMKLILSVTVDCAINGFKIEKYEIQTSHRFSEVEYADFMEQILNQKPEASNQ